MRLPLLILLFTVSFASNFKVARDLSLTSFLLFYLVPIVGGITLRVENSNFQTEAEENSNFRNRKQRSWEDDIDDEDDYFDLAGNQKYFFFCWFGSDQTWRHEKVFRWNPFVVTGTDFFVILFVYEIKHKNESLKLFFLFVKFFFVFHRPWKSVQKPGFFFLQPLLFAFFFFSPFILDSSFEKTTLRYRRYMHADVVFDRLTNNKLYFLFGRTVGFHRSYVSGFFFVFLVTLQRALSDKMGITG